MIRFRNSDVMENIDRVLDEMEKFIQTHPDPLFKKREGDLEKQEEIEENNKAINRENSPLFAKRG